jgi:cell division protein ZapA
MAEVTIEVGGRTYRLACENGEEEHLSTLGARMDAEARRLLRSMGQMPEGRLMLMAGLMVADKLHDAEVQTTRLERDLAAAEKAAGSGALSDEREAELTAEIASLAERLENLAKAATPSPGLPFDGDGKGTA